MRNLYLVLVSSLFLSTQIQSQNVGIGTVTPIAKLSVGSASQFQVNSTGNIVMINNVPYSFPTAQGTNQYLMNNGSGTLVWGPAPRPVARVFSMVSDGGSNWLIDNPADYDSGSNEDPELTLYRGFRYHFINNSGGHPFVISDEDMMGFYTIGLINNGGGSGAIEFIVPMDAPDTLYYYCSIHPSMSALINIK